MSCIFLAHKRNLVKNELKSFFFYEHPFLGNWCAQSFSDAGKQTAVFGWELLVHRHLRLMPVPMLDCARQEKFQVHSHAALLNVDDLDTPFSATISVSQAGPFKNSIRGYAHKIQTN